MGVGLGDGDVGDGRGEGGVGDGRTVWVAVALGAAADASFREAVGVKCSVRAKKSMNVEMPTRRTTALDRISLTPGLMKPTPWCRPFHPYHPKFGKSPTPWGRPTAPSIAPGSGRWTERKVEETGRKPRQDCGLEGGQADRTI